MVELKKKLRINNLPFFTKKKGQNCLKNGLRILMFII